MRGGLEGSLVVGLQFFSVDCADMGGDHRGGGFRTGSGGNRAGLCAGDRFHQVDRSALRTGDRDRQVALLLAVVDGLALRLLDPEAGATVADARAVLRDAVGVVVLDG